MMMFVGGIQLKHYKFAIGRVDLRKSDGVLVSGKEHYLHPGYNERDPYIMNDIALVKLAQPVPLSDDIQVIGIASVEIPVGTWVCGKNFMVIVVIGMGSWMGRSKPRN